MVPKIRGERGDREFKTVLNQSSAQILPKSTRKFLRFGVYVCKSVCKRSTSKKSIKSHL